MEEMLAIKNLIIPTNLFNSNYEKHPALHIGFNCCIYWWM